MSRTLNFALALLLPVIAFAQATVSQLVPSSAPPGARVLITGQGLADPTLAVSFTSSASAFIVSRNNSYLEVVVPAKAVTGNVRITSGATLVRELPFTVSNAPSYTVSTLAGGKSSGNEPLKHPWGAAVVMPEGTIAVADEQHHRVVMITPAGAVSSLAGNGKQGFKNGKGTAASFKSPRGITFDPVRRVLYVADTGNSSIREVALDGTVKTLAGDGKQGYKNGTGSAAQFRDPHGLTVGADGAIYVADAKNYRIRKVTTAGVTTSFAGTGSSGNGPVDGPLASATFYDPLGIVAHGNDFYVADTKNNAIRKISGGQVTTVIGFPRTGDGDGDDGDDECDGDDDGCAPAAVLKRPIGIGVDEAGNLIVSDSHNDRIRRIILSVTPPVMTTIAGTGKNGDTDGPGHLAQFKDPVGLTVAGAIYVADEDNDAIRRLCAELRVTGFFTPTGTVTAGTKVRVLGSGFVPGGTVVKIGGTASTEVEWISSTELSVKLPQNVTGGNITLTASACGGTTSPVTFPVNGTPPPPVDTTPPVITTTNGGAPLADNSSFRVPVVPVITAADAVDPAPVVTATLNGLPFVSGTTVSADGQHVLVVQARDAAGNTATKTVPFFIDATPPAVTVLEGTAPFPAGQVFHRAVVIDLVIVDISTTTKDVRIDGAPYVLRQPFAVPGAHTLTVSVTDALGNVTTVPPIPFSIVIDNSGPVLTFTSHTEGAVVSTPEVIVGGGSDDAVSVTVNGAPATVDPVLRTFVSGTLTLVEGTNTITAIGTDSSGNIGTAVLHLELDTRAPELTITAPAADACLDATSLTVTGTVTDPRVQSVKVNDVTATITNGNWTASVPVAEGQQTLTVVAADTLGHLTTVTRSVLIDRTAPELEVRESGAAFTGTLFNRAVTLLVRATDADGNAQVTATLDGAAYTSGTTISAEGAHTLAVTAVDCAGHSETRSYPFTIDRTPPAIRNHNPAHGGTVGTMPTSIAATTDPDAVKIELLGTAITATPAPDATFVLSGVAFEEGTNRFVLRATDRAGNSEQYDYTVTVKTNAPVVSILEGGAPLVTNSVFTRPVTVEIKVNDPAATLSATNNGAPFTSGTTLTADGEYRIIATATNALNHTGRAETFFRIDRTAPTVTITFPQSGLVPSEQIEVRGTATNAVSADVNGYPVTLDANGNFVLPTLYLEFGTTRIVVTARDSAGNFGMDEVEVTRDDVRPGIILTYPPDRALTNRPATEVLGRVLSTSPTGFVTIGTQTTPVDPLGAFRLSGYPLVEGDNTITASTTTAGGTTVNSASVVVTADFTPPALTILESNQPLNDGARFATEAVLSTQASDNRGTVTVDVTIDGTKVLSTPHTVTATGGHAAVAVARDQAGNQTRVERTFFVGATGGGGATCTLDGFDPANGAVVLSASTTLLGRTTSEGVKANNIAANVADGSFRATVELPQEGANTVTLRCTDAAGVAFGDPVTLTLNRVTGDPSIEITSPEEGFVTAAEAITVTGTVGPGVVSADVNGAAAVIAGNDPSIARPFTVPGVRLASGLNVLVAHGRNAAGRVATASRRIFALRNEPVITISSPVSGTSTGAAKIDVAGTFGELDPATIVVTNLANSATTPAQSVRLSDTNGTYTAVDVPLVSGEQTLRVTGRDQANRTATASVTVRVTPGTPSISITSPTNQAYFGPNAGASFTVTGTFAAANGSTVDVAGTAATIDGTTFTATTPFSTIGSNTTVIARVSEPSGLSAVDTVVVTKLAAAPKVLESFPAPNAVEVDAGALLLVLFSAPMDRSTLAGGAFRLEDANGATVSGTLFLDKDVLTFAPAALLTRGARYTLRVTTGAKDVAGSALETEWAAPFTVGTSAPSTPPTLTPVSEAFCGQTVMIRGTAPAGARLQLSASTLTLTTLADAQGNFTFNFPLSGQSGYAVVRVRIVGGDGSLSPAAELTFRVDCIGPQVLNATYDRGGANRLTIEYSEPVTVPAGAVYATLTDGRTVAVSNDTPAEDLTARTFTLNVTTAVTDPIGNHLVVPYSQTFTAGGEQPPTGDGSGFISGEIYDATTGRPLAGATITVEIANASFSTNSDSRGRYLVRLPEGAHTIRASMTGFTSVWRQILVPAGAGIVPIDIRLTERNGTGTHGGETAITRPVTVTAPAKVTAIGAQALTGLLPLGWSPLTAAEVLGDATNATLSFTVPAADITAVSQTLTAVRYDEVRDEWNVLAAVVTITNGKVDLPMTTAGSYALVYADKAPGLAVPPLAQTGAALAGVAAPAEQAPLVSQAFTLNPPIVLPNGRTVATLQIEGTAGATFPSGTAVQAYIDEELRLADGSRLLDPPFATDLLLYRSLGGSTGNSDFHLAPSPRAAQVILEVGFDHIRVVPYPGRLDRGTLVGNEGGRIPGDDRIAVDIPAGATPEALRATAVSLTQQDLDSVGAIQGFQILGGFTLTLQRATPAQPQDIDGDGQPDAQPPAVELFKPARATFTLSTQHSALSTPMVVVELLDQTPYGKMVRLAAQIERPSAARATTTTIDRSVLPVDGIAHEGRYLLLAADAPIAFATGVLRLGSATGSLLPSARITANSLGVADLTRTDGIYNIPVLAAPAAPFSLTPRRTETGDGATYTHASSPAAGAVVPVNLTLVPQPPRLTSVSVFAGNPPAQITLGGDITNVSPSTGVRATFTPAIDPASVTDDAIKVVDASSGIAVSGKATADGNLAVNWALTPGTTLQSGHRYIVVISPGIRAPNGAELGNVTTYGFATAAVVLNTEVRAERISITIPVNGVSRVTGGAGALPAGWQALVVRRGRDFITRYQATAAADGGFTFLAGNGGDHADRVSMGDLIDLRVVNNAGNLAAIIPLTPFVTEDRRGFIVPAGVATRFVTADNIVVDVPAGTFDEPTMVTANVVAKTVLNDVPALDNDVNVAATVKLDFEGTANNPIEVEVPVPAGMETANRSFILALKGQSIRGPRIMAVDTLRIVNGKFSTTLDPSPGARRVQVQTHSGGVATNETLTGNDLKDYLLRVQRSGIYTVVDIRVPVGGAVGWAAMEGLQSSYDIFWNVLASFYAAHTYIVERGRIAIPVLQNVPFTVVGVDARTGMQAFTKDYDPIPIGDPGISTLPSPQVNQGGPYPVFAAPFRVDIVDLNVPDMEIKTARNFIVELTNGNVYVRPSSDPLPATTKVEVLNVTNGQFASGTASSTMVLSGDRGHRLVLLIEERQIDPNTPISVVFSEPIYIVGTEEDQIHEFLKTKIKLLKAPLPEDADDPPTFTDISDQVRFTADSGGRRISLGLPSSLQREATYRVTLDRTIADKGGESGSPGLTLGQGAQVSSGTASGIGGGNDFHLELRVRKPGGTIGTFELQSGITRDLALNGNVLLVGAAGGGVVAYDVGDPASLQGVPTPIAVAPSPTDEVWALASDHHGRIYTTNLGPVAGALRSYRLEDFTDGGTCCKVYGSTLTNWRVGYSSNLGLFSNTMLSDRPESFPRKLQLAVQDQEQVYEGRAAFVDATGASMSDPYLNGMVKMSVSFGIDAGHPYRIQRITVENQTLDMRWSGDATDQGGTTIQNILAGPNDRIRVIRNRTTYGFISHLGYGIGMYDLNAIESNRVPNPPGGSRQAAEQVALTRGLIDRRCPGTSQDINVNEINEIWLSSDTAIRPEPGTSNLLAYAPDPYRGLLDLRFKPPAGPNAGTSINNSISCDQRGPAGLIIRAVDPSQDHPRIQALKALYPGNPGVHFYSVANYTWRLEAADNKKGVRRSVANQPVQRDYVLLAGGDLGLLVIEVAGNPSPTPEILHWPLNPIHLADIIWTPSGALAVRVIPRTNFAVVTSRNGRVHLIDLSRIDERFGSTGAAIPENVLFPTAAAAIAGAPQWPGAVGAPDPRIVWTSEPNVALGALAPVVDPDTGMMYGGQLINKTLKAVAAIDPRVQLKVDLGKEQLSEVGGIVPHGIDPPKRILDQINELPLCDGSTPRCRENASLGTFRIEISLPGQIAQLLTESNNELQVAVESERVFNAVTEQTPVGFPRSHLRRFHRGGEPEEENRDAATFRLQRLVPEEDAALTEALRYQAGFNKFVSPWIVALADPRASAQYAWPNGESAEQKAKAGCHFCERPKYLEDRTEEDGVYELWTNGRLIAVRPEVIADGNNIFAGTPYAYLGEENRLVTRFATVMADTVRDTKARAAGQNPPVADGAVQDTVYLHSGELQTGTLDLNAGGRAGFDVLVDRTYRSRTIGGTALGQGWESSNFRRLRALPNGDVELRDSSGEIWLFTVNADGTYESPRGFFLKLLRIDRGWMLLDQKWRATGFDDFGRLMFETDEFAEDIAVAAGTNKGNVIRYLYDHTGRLVQVVDPVERPTGLTYWEQDDTDEEGAYPGLLKEVRDWRDRSTLYEYDDRGRLVKVKAPEVKAGEGVPGEFNHSGDNRPTTEYGYGTIAAPASGATPTQAFSNYIEFVGNLQSIKEPGGTNPRVTLDYDEGGSNQRDHLMEQRWATGENVTFGYASATNASSTDAYGTTRHYTLTEIDEYDERNHIAEGTVQGVAVIESGAGGAPSVALAHTTATLTAEFTYNAEGLHDLIEYANGLRVENTWRYAKDPSSNGNREPSIAPGMVLETSSVTGPGLPSSVDTDFKYDTSSPTARATQIAVGRGSGGDFEYRDDQSASRDRATVSQKEEGFTSETKYNDFGLPTAFLKKDGDEIVQQTTTEYYPAATEPLLARSRTSKIESGSDVSQSFVYSDLEDGAGGEKIGITDDKRGVTTETHLDTHGRKTYILVTDTNETVLTKESFGYDAAGRLAYHSRQQRDVGNVETRIGYDDMGRETSRSTTGASVNGSPASLAQSTDHDYAGRKITETGPGAKTTVTTLDALGRPMVTEEKSGPALVRTITGYDRSGAVSYESDGVRNATVALNDARGRQIVAVTADGIRTETTWGEWDEPLEIVEKGSDGSVVSHTKNFFTDFGRLRSTTEGVDAGGRARSTYLTWTEGDTERGTRIGEAGSISDQAPDGPVRVQQQSFNAVGRLTREVFGASSGTEGAPTNADIFSENEYAYGNGSVPTQVTAKEPRAGASSTTSAVFDGLERPLATAVEGAEPTTMTYDEAGNVLTLEAPGLGVSAATYDSRGLVTSSTHPGGGSVATTYDALGGRRSYTDESGAVTSFTTDGLGRVTAVSYPDGTSETTVYEAGSGLVLATKGRDDKWLGNKYGPGGRLLSVHDGQGPDAPVLVEYSYDGGGHVTRVRNKDAAIEYDDYDLLGRPKLTRTIRYTNGSGLGAPVTLDVHTQTHTWSVFDDERESWRMPAAGPLPMGDNTASPWLGTIVETRDAGSNLVQQQSGSSILTTGDGRAVSKLKSRLRSAGPTQLETLYAYTGDAGTIGAKSFRIASATTKAGAATIGGSVNTRDAADRIKTTQDVGMSNRASQWMYDARGRLQQSWLDLGASTPPTVDGLTPASFRASRTIPPFLSPSQHQDLGPVAKQIEPLSWTATKNAANQLVQRDATLDGQVADSRVYTFTGGRRTKDGDWTAEFDELGRLQSSTNTVLGRRIEYAWDPNDRMVGRAAFRRNSDPEATPQWLPENRLAVLQSDGLPARTTFVWDPIEDRLVAIFEEGRSTTVVGDADAGLLRQYLHGDQGYDDPIRVLAADASGVVHTYLPLVDEAGTGSLHSIVDAATGNIVERVLYADSYGDAPRYLQGAVVDAIDVEVDKAVDDTVDTVKVLVHFTEAIESTSLSGGVRLAAINAQNALVRETAAVPELQDPFTLLWELDAEEWTALTGNGTALEIRIRDTLRSIKWGTTPVSNAPPWAQDVYGVLAEPNAPVIARQSFASLTAFIDGIAASGTKKTNVYGMTDLYLAASPESKTKLFTGFKAAPFVEPATSLVYFRARWYDPATGAFLTPDPAGYADSSNLYAGFAGDPVNNADPSGEIVESIWDAASLGMGIYSISQWDENTSFWEKALDVVGVGLDGAALALPFIPGGVGAGLKAYRVGNVAYDTYNVGRKAAKVLDVAQGIEQAASAVQAGVRLYEDYTKGELSIANVFDVVQVGMGVRKAAKAARTHLPKKQPMQNAGYDAPCPFSVVPALECLAGGTPISTPAGVKPIDELRVGDRVAATLISGIPEETDSLDARQWHLLKLRVPNPDDPENVYEIETLRPLAWVVEHEAYAGRTITFATERNPDETAYVVSLERMPEIADGPGRVVLSRFTHRDQLLKLHFEGEAPALELTPSHRVFSVRHDNWIPASELQPGDDVRTRDGKATIAAVEQQESARVFDLEIESDHSYFIAGSDLLAHNCGGAPKKRKKYFSVRKEDYPTRIRKKTKELLEARATNAKGQIECQKCKNVLAPGAGTPEHRFGKKGTLVDYHNKKGWNTTPENRADAYNDLAVEWWCRACQAIEGGSSTTTYRTDKGPKYKRRRSRK